MAEKTNDVKSPAAVLARIDSLLSPSLKAYRPNPEHCLAPAWPSVAVRTFPRLFSPDILQPYEINTCIIGPRGRIGVGSEHAARVMCPEVSKISVSSHA